MSQMNLPGETKIIQHKNEKICSPMRGIVKELREMPAGKFFDYSLGKGICIVPREGKIVSPCNGTLTSIFPTGHAYRITSDQGAEILIHIHTDKKKLNDGFFKIYKKQGDRVRMGEVLTEFDLTTLVNDGHSPNTMMLVTNSSDTLDVISVCEGDIDYNENMLIIIKSERSVQ